MKCRLYTCLKHLSVTTVSAKKSSDPLGPPVNFFRNIISTINIIIQVTFKSNKLKNFLGPKILKVDRKERSGQRDTFHLLWLILRAELHLKFNKLILLMTIIFWSSYGMIQYQRKATPYQEIFEKKKIPMIKQSLNKCAIVVYIAT